MADNTEKNLSVGIPHYITFRVVDAYPLFLETPIRQALFHRIKKMNAYNIKIYAFIIMPNHIHLIAEGQELERQVQLFRRKSAVQIVRFLLNENKWLILKHLTQLAGTNIATRPTNLWSGTFLYQPLTTMYALEEHIHRVHYNPVNAGIVSRPESWRWSSARMYSGSPTPLNMEDFHVPQSTFG